MMVEAKPPIRIVRASHMRYQHADIEKTHEFLLDFGMKLVAEDDDTRWYTGEGPDAYVYVAKKGKTSQFLGGVFLVESQEDLERASAEIPGASKVMQYDGPAGGFWVTLTDPDNLPVNLVWGLKASFDQSSGETPTVNFPKTKPRKGEFRRFDRRPCPVYKLGHFGLLVSNFQQTYEFYTKWFNLKATDILTAPDGSQVAGFMHVDREEEWVDHHTFFFSQNSKRISVHHCSYEVHDSDVQAIAHDWLASKGYQLSWGVGRHILGSQVFDYWYMPDDFMIEHYSDGDQVNGDHPTGYLAAADESLAIWGPAVPEGFMDAIPDSKQTLPVNGKVQAVA